jgi:hypothetical protein
MLQPQGTGTHLSRLSCARQGQSHRPTRGEHHPAPALSLPPSSSGDTPGCRLPPADHHNPPSPHNLRNPLSWWLPCCAVQPMSRSRGVGNNSAVRIGKVTSRNLDARKQWATTHTQGARGGTHAIGLEHRRLGRFLCDLQCKYWRNTSRHTCDIRLQGACTEAHTAPRTSSPCFVQSCLRCSCPLPGTDSGPIVDIE